MRLFSRFWKRKPESRQSTITHVWADFEIDPATVLHWVPFQAQLRAMGHCDLHRNDPNPTCNDWDVYTEEVQAESERRIKAELV